MGFCLVNHAVVAVHYATGRWNLSRAGILDVDVHHGNGIAELLANSNSTSVRYASIHQRDAFPQTATVEGSPTPSLFHVPLDAGSAGMEWRQALEKKIFPWLSELNPELFIVSLGFD